VPHHQDAIKRLKQNEKRRTRNRHFRTKMRNEVKRVREAVSSGNVEEAQSSLKVATSIIHRVANKGIIHRNQAGRKIQRLNNAVKALATGA